MHIDIFVLRSSEKYLKERNVSKLSAVMVHSHQRRGSHDPCVPGSGKKKTLKNMF